LYIYMYVYTYIYIHTQTYICTHTQAPDALYDVVTRLAEACTEYATLRRRVLGDDGVAEREGVLQEGEVERGRESDSERSRSSSAMEVGHGGLSVGGGGREGGEGEGEGGEGGRFIQSRERGIVGKGGGGEEGTMGYWNAMEALSQSRSALQLASRMGL
jgi:hypothetical protein